MRENTLHRLVLVYAGTVYPITMIHFYITMSNMKLKMMIILMAVGIKRAAKVTLTSTTSIRSNRNGHLHGRKLYVVKCVVMIDH